MDHDDDTLDGRLADWPNLPDFTEAEGAMLAEAVATGATAALGMLCTATFVPQASAFVVRPAVVASPESFH